MSEGMRQPPRDRRPNNLDSTEMNVLRRTILHADGVSAVPAEVVVAKTSVQVEFPLGSLVVFPCMVDFVAESVVASRDMRTT